MLSRIFQKQKSVRLSNELINTAKSGNKLEFVNNFYGISITQNDIEDFDCFMRVINLKSNGLSPRKISNLTGKSKSTIENWIFNQSVPPIIQLLKNYRKLGNSNRMKWLSINSTRGGLFTGPWLSVSEKVENYSDVLFVINKIKPLSESYKKLKEFEINKKNFDKLKPQLLAYLLGFMIGDSSKDEIKRKMRVTRRISINLSKGLPSNNKLGEFVVLCANSVGLRMGRIKDMPKGRKNTNPFYRWNSQSSPLVQWLFSSCLGLKDDENTTYNPIKADWILKAPREFKIWFIQGLADSDGFIDLSSLQAGIITHPNTDLIRSILASLDVNTTTKLFTSNGLFALMLNIKDAYNLPIFNPHVNSYRYILMEKVYKSERISGHWPKWLVDKVNYYIKGGFSGTEVVRLILDEYGIATRAQKVNRRLKTKIRGGGQ